MQIRNLDLVRRTGNELLGRQLPILDETSDDMVGHPELLRGLRHSAPIAVLVGREVAVDPPLSASEVDPSGGPCIALPGTHAHPVERGGDVVVGPAAHHALYDGHGFVSGSPAMFATLQLADPQLRMLTASPMDRQDDLAGLVVDIGEDIGDQGAHDALAGTHGYARRVPRGLQVRSEACQIGDASLRVGGLHRVEPHFACLDALERRLLALLELGGDQAIVRIAGGIAPLGKRGLVAGLLKIQLGQALAFAQLLHAYTLGLQRSFDCHGFDDTDYLVGNCGIHTSAAECLAALKPVLELPTVATIGRSGPAAWVDGRHLAVATCTAEGAAEQRSSAASRLHATRLAEGIGGNLVLITFELRPVDVALVVILQQNLPLLHRFAASIALAHMTVHDLRLHLRTIF